MSGPLDFLAQLSDHDRPKAAVETLESGSKQQRAPTGTNTARLTEQEISKTATISKTAKKTSPATTKSTKSTSKGKSPAVE